MTINVNTNTYKLSATTTTSAVTLKDGDVDTREFVAYNAGSSDVFLVGGITAPTAVFPTSATVPVAGKVLAAGSTQAYEKHNTHGYISGITASGSSDVYISPRGV